MKSFVYTVSAIVTAISPFMLYSNQGASCYIPVKIRIGGIFLPIPLINSIVVKDSRLSEHLE